ncbi:DUF6879 family protein [Actinomadura sp. 9N215]|uniref:DUF6879 family protein n=1 Tax=Actinomadura sp. 9N215 TaxID=3375150 RepID=UPI00379F511A
MLDRVPFLPAASLGATEYVAEVTARSAEIEDFFWKLERRQTFQEPGDASYRAFARGDWSEAVRIKDEGRDTLRQRFAEQGFVLRRIRVVESPVTPYLQWEIQALRVRAEAGEEIRVLDASVIRDREADRPMPEVIILGTKVLYEVLYDEAGLHSGGRRIANRAVIDACRAEMAALWGKGEDITSYFAREIAPLPPPPAQP